MIPGRYRSLDDPETLRLFVRNLSEGIYITNAAGEILDANPACLEILGVPSLELPHELQAGLEVARVLVPGQRVDAELAHTREHR